MWLMYEVLLPLLELEEFDSDDEEFDSDDEEEEEEEGELFFLLYIHS